MPGHDPSPGSPEPVAVSAAGGLSGASRDSPMRPGRHVMPRVPCAASVPCVPDLRRRRVRRQVLSPSRCPALPTARDRAAYSDRIRRPLICAGTILTYRSCSRAGQVGAGGVILYPSGCTAVDVKIRVAPAPVIDPYLRELRLGAIRHSRLDPWTLP
jgi:hypothetical protein